METEERRAYRRFNITIPIEYKFASFQENMTKTSTLDISANGLRFTVKERPLAEDEVHIILDLPQKQRALLAAKVIWSKDLDEGECEIGVKLADTKSEDGKIFMDFYSEQLLKFVDATRDQARFIK